MNDKIEFKTELASIIHLARGDRSLRKYGLDAGVSYNTIHMIEKGELMPSREIIEKLTSKSANPQNGVTYQAVMNAAGFKTQNDDMAISDAAYDMASRLIEEEKDKFYTARRFRSASEREEDLRRIKTLTRGIIFDALFEQGIEFGVNPIKDSHYRLRSRDMLLSLNIGGIKEWLLTILCTSSGGSLSSLLYQDTLARFMTFEGGKDIKFSLVTNDPSTYAKFKKSEHKLLFRGELSIIMVDTNYQKIVDETYLSNYFLGEYSNEFFIN